MNENLKAKNILIAAVFFLFLTVTFTIFYKNFKEYFGFLTVWSESKYSLSSAKSFVKPKIKTPKTSIKIISFSLNAPYAKEVFLHGNFYDEQKIAMKKADSGIWHIKLALTAKTYFYYFEVDGEPAIDKSNPHTENVQGKIYSVLVVEK